MSQNKHDAYNEAEKPAEDPQVSAENEAQTAAPPDEAAPDEAGRLRAELERARAEAAENQERFLRAKAETENVRRRAEIDLANAHKYGIEKFAAEVLSVRDSLELARAVEVKSGDDELLNKMLEGLDLTLKQMDRVFEKFNLSVIDPRGEAFDPERHQAISMVDSDEVAPNHVVTVVQKGALLNDRLLRPALVIIAKAKSGENAGGQA